MKRFFAAIGRFFVPPANASTLAKVAPYITVAFLMVVLFVFSTVAWEYTNTVKFCGLSCHTMPPQYTTQQNSPHAAVSCEDCHLGRDVMGVMIPRKIEYSWQTGTAMITNSYHYPIIAKNMRPARDACENCHDPTKFSSDKLFELKRYASDQANTLTTIYMMLKTGGGTKRQGLGFGIHWHVENPVYYYATDAQAQTIPYVLVTRADGSTTEYVDVEANFDPKSIKKDQLQVMDCITCHNRTAHDSPTPSAMMDSLLSRGLVWDKIPDIHKKGIEVLSANYADQDAGVAAIANLENFYKQTYADFYGKNTAMVQSAILSIQAEFKKSVFPEQKFDSTTHPDNMQHKDYPGCFRCHDGKHLSSKGEAVRLECNLCHSVPTISTVAQLVSNIPVSKGFEPDSHKNSNWINLHRGAFDKSCASCHSVEDPGGVSNKSFCSNSVCHGATWKFAGFDAPKVREAIKSQLPTPAPTIAATAAPKATAAPTQAGAQATAAPAAGGGATFADVSALFEKKCLACHGDTAIKGLSLTTYAKVMAGASDGPVIVAGKPDESVLVKVQTAGNHPGQLTPEEIDVVKKWISAGALEK